MAATKVKSARGMLVQFKNLGKTIDKEVSMLRAELGQLQKEVGNVKTGDEAATEQLNQKGILIGDKFLRLEKCAPTSSRGGTLVCMYCLSHALEKG
jgi:hypothetical protein